MVLVRFVGDGEARNAIANKVEISLFFHVSVSISWIVWVWCGFGLVVWNLRQILKNSNPYVTLL